MYRLTVLLLSIVLSPLGHSTNLTKPVNQTLRTISSGQIIGTIGRDGSYAWKGIPYAEAPVKNLRWRAPRPAKPWDKPLKTINFGSRCTQIAPKDEEGIKKDTLIGSEDCLFINVWSPPLNGNIESKHLPVLFWIHGGANVIGHAGQYDPATLAVKHKLIIVSINYRLGPLGWFAHKSLRNSALTKEDRSANFGTLDMIAALKWVQNNIATFGGDPDRVTVFGESAGGHNTASLLVSPLSKGLFHRAMIISGLFVSPSLKDAEYTINPHKSDKTSSTTVINHIYGDNQLNQLSAIEARQQLQELSVEALFDSYREQQSGDNIVSSIAPYTVIADDVVLPKEGLKNALLNGNYHPMPIISGTNRDEIKGANMADPKLTGNLFKLIFWPKDKAQYKAYAEYRDRIWRLHAVDTPAKILSSQAGQDIYTYRFDWDDQGWFLLNNLSELIGAMHTLSIPFWMGNFDDVDNDPTGHFFNKNNKYSSTQLADAMMSYLANFAYSGKPGKGVHQELPEWASWANANDNAKLMVFDTPEDGGIRMNEAPETINRIAKDLAADQNFNSDRQKCESLKPARLFFNNIVQNVITESGIQCER